jgi:hypothetical protein
MIIFARFFLIILVAFIVSDCSGKPRQELVLFDFESDSELDQLQWTCHSLYTLSNEHSTHGTKSIKMELYPSNYPGLTPKLKINDWSGYGAFCFDAYNPQKNAIPLVVRIDDQRQYPIYEDRFNKEVLLQPGLNHISIPLSTLLTSGKRRRLNVTSISRVLFFLSHPSERIVLYLDYLRLSSS